MGVSKSFPCTHENNKCYGLFRDWSTAGKIPEPHEYPPGIELLRQDVPIRAVYLIHEGMLKLEHLGADGGAVIIGLRGPDSMHGAAEAMIGVTSPCAAVTIQPTSASSIAVTTFRDLLEKDSEFATYVLKALSLDRHQQMNHAIEIGARSACERLLHFLSGLACECARDGRTTSRRIRLPLSHSELAHLLAVTPSYLCHLFDLLESKGTIERKKGWIVIADPSVL